MQQPSWWHTFSFQLSPCCRWCCQEGRWSRRWAFLSCNNGFLDPPCSASILLPSHFAAQGNTHMHACMHARVRCHLSRWALHGGRRPGASSLRQAPTLQRQTRGGATSTLQQSLIILILWCSVCVISSYNFSYTKSYEKLWSEANINYFVTFLSFRKIEKTLVFIVSKTIFFSNYSASKLFFEKIAVSTTSMAEGMCNWFLNRTGHCGSAPF